MGLTEKILERLSDAGLELEQHRVITPGVFEQLRFKTGEIVCIYLTTGTIVPQGHGTERVRQLLGIKNSGNSKKKRKKQRVFVVYGHDRTARAQLEAMLLRWGLEPLILDQLASGGQTIIEKLEQYSDSEVSYAVVLATPDDEGHRCGKPEERRFRARQNVVLELGLLLAKLGRSRVAILLKNAVDLERPSDIDGLVYIPFVHDVDEVKVPLAKEMARQGVWIPVQSL